MKVRLPAEMQGACVMCGGPGPLTDEHVISRTVRKQLPLLTPVVQTFAGISQRPTNVLHAVVADCLCGPCNNEWMSRLETDFVRIMGSHLANPRIVMLNPSQQERVATWTIKTALMLEIYTMCCGKGAYVPTDNLRWLAKHESPPPGSRVWLAGVESNMKRAAWSQAGSLSVRSGESVAYLATLSIGCVGFQVFGRDIFDSQSGEVARELPALDPPEQIKKTLVEVWPGTGNDARWPPETLIHVDALPAVAAWPSAMFSPPPGG
jgi:hypothetical protein